MVNGEIRAYLHYSINPVCISFSIFYPMSERLYQLRFDQAGQQLEIGLPQDVTPSTFNSERFSIRGRDITPRISFNPNTEAGRFVREITTPYQVTSPAHAARYLQENVFNPFEACRQEELWALCLNTKNRITHDAMIYRGNVNSSVIRIAEVFRPAIILSATAMIVAHCHPSGDPTPSPEDANVTHCIAEAGELLGIELLDHLVIGDRCWASLKERGLGFSI